MREASSTGSETSAEMTSVEEGGEVTHADYDISHIDGFAEIFPEDKHMIVTLLQGKGFVVGMTGDGANVRLPLHRHCHLSVPVIIFCFSELF